LRESYRRLLLLNDKQNLQEPRRVKILVTGGAGFIGSHLVDRLSVENRVTVLDKLPSGSPSNLEKSKHRITFIDDDIRGKALVLILI